MSQPRDQLDSSGWAILVLIIYFFVKFLDLSLLEPYEHGVIIGLYVVSIVHACQQFGLLLGNPYKTQDQECTEEFDHDHQFDIAHFGIDLFRRLLAFVLKEYSWERIEALVNCVVVTKFLDELPEVLDEALRGVEAVLFEELMDVSVVEDLVADVWLLTGTLHLIFEVGCDAKIYELCDLPCITSESCFIMRHHGVDMTLRFRKAHITQR